MRKKHYIYTKPNIVSVRLSDDEMEFVQKVVVHKKMKASEILRQAFVLLLERFENEGGDAGRALRQASGARTA